MLWVRDADRAGNFYTEALGLQVAARVGDGAAVFMRSPIGDNDHDLGLFSVGAAAPAQRPGGVGLYHVAWEVGSVSELIEARSKLGALGALIGESDHGVSKSLYAKDPDGNEFEVAFFLAPDERPEHPDPRPQPLDLESELSRFG